MASQSENFALIRVVGVGGAGSNAVNRMIRAELLGVEFIAVNTDAQALVKSHAPTRIRIGDAISRGLGAGGDSVVGERAAQEDLENLRKALDGSDLVFVTAGMGGGTGTGAAPVIARIAKEMGILTVGVVTKPFEFEGGRRMTNADLGLAELEANVDSLIVVLNEKLLEVLGDEVTQDQAFAHANDVLKNAVGGIAEIINEYGNVNVDFEDVRTVMGEPGKAMMGTAVANGPDRARIAAEQAVACPLLEGIDLSGAKGVLVLVTAAKGSLKLSESKLAMNTIRAYASADAHVIYGAAYDDKLGDDIRVTVVATGLGRQGVRRHAPPLQVLRTGTDNVPFNAPTLNTVAGMNNMVGVSQSSTGSAQPDYGNMAVPSVWRTNRTQAAAKVDALASGGMDDFEIPAFLRKQAD